jgi:hypothetical protein
LVVCFFEFLTPSTLRGNKFLNFIPFLTIFWTPNVSIRRVQVLFRHQKQWSLPLGFNLPWTLKCYNYNSITTQFAPNEQLKDLTHMFYLLLPCYKLYKEILFFYFFTLKYMCHFGMNLKKLNLKAKHKIKNKVSWLFFSAHSLVLYYLLTYLLK